MAAAHFTSWSRATSRCGLSRSSKGMSRAGRSSRPTGWKGTWLKLRSRCGAVATMDATMRAP
jgi:hypothetical protein